MRSRVARGRDRDVGNSELVVPARENQAVFCSADETCRRGHQAVHDLLLAREEPGGTVEQTSTCRSWPNVERVANALPQLQITLMAV